MDFPAFVANLGSWILKAGVFLGTLSILVVLHEWGHFILARLAGVRVLEFSFGMGKRLFSRRWGDTEYQFRLIPLGGFVRMAGDDALQSPDRPFESHEFYGVSVYRRLGIVLGGPIMNWILAIAVIWLFFSMVDVVIWKPVLGYLHPQSAGWQAGLRPGDQILKIQGKPVPTFQDLETVIKKSPGIPLAVTLQRRDVEMELEVVPDLAEEQDPLGDPVFRGRIGLNQFRNTVIDHVMEDGPAHRAGMHDGDRILSIDGHRVTFWEEMQNVIYEKIGVPVVVEWERDEQVLSATVVPEARELIENAVSRRTVGMIGMQKVQPEDGLATLGRLSAGEALGHAWDRIWETTWLTYRSIPKLITGEISRDNMAGPVRLAGIITHSAASGFLTWLSMLGIISLMLAIFNLLPIPMLDGGHAAFFTFEMVTGWVEKLVHKPLIRRPMNFKFIEVLNRVGVSLLIFLFLFVTYNDILYLVRSGN